MEDLAIPSGTELCEPGLIYELLSTEILPQRTLPFAANY